jgi:hypothetical protein
MRKKHIIVGLAVLCGVLAVAICWIASSRTNMVTPAVAFIGYTNSSAGIAQAIFVITNRAADTFDLLTDFMVGTGQPVMHTPSKTPLTASTMRLAPGAVVTVTIARPAQTGAWKASFAFLPTRPPPLYRLKRALHRAGVRGLDMALPTFSASSDLIEL